MTRKSPVFLSTLESMSVLRVPCSVDRGSSYSARRLNNSYKRADTYWSRQDAKIDLFPISSCFEHISAGYVTSHIIGQHLMCHVRAFYCLNYMVKISIHLLEQS